MEPGVERFSREDVDETTRRAAEASRVPIVITGGGAHHVRYANAAFHDVFTRGSDREHETRLARRVGDTGGLEELLERAARTATVQFAPHVTYLDAADQPVQATTMATPIAGGCLVVHFLEVTTDAEQRMREQEVLRELIEANQNLTLAGVREQELADRADERAAEIEALLASMSEGVAIFDADCAIVMMNARGRELMDLSREAGAPDFARLKLTWPSGQPVEVQDVLARLRRGERIENQAMVLRRSDGSVRHILFGLGSVRDPEDRVRLAIMVFRDVTQLRELERIRDRYFAVISHDLRNPLAGAMAATQLLVATATREADRGLAQRIEKNLRRMDEMLRELLEVQRLRAGQPLPLELAEVDLRALARDAIDDVAAVYGDRFELRGDERAVGIWSAAELRRAIWNLLTNAAKYGAQDRPITITVTQLPAGAVLVVHNEGAPIPAQDQPQLFSAFRRVSSEAAVQGWGLGLAQVHACAEAHGGAVSVQSDAASGTTFTLMLPLIAGEGDR